jgi:hypothetical protein
MKVILTKNMNQHKDTWLQHNTSLILLKIHVQ